MGRKILIVAATLLSLVGCNATKYNQLDNQAYSSFGESPSHGEQSVEVVLGAFLSQSSKNKLGKKMNLEDQQLAGAVAYNSLEYSIDHVGVSWENPESHHKGTFEIIKTEGRPNLNLVCRKFTHLLEIDGQQEQMSGEACRDMWDPRDGWVLQG